MEKTNKRNNDLSIDSISKDVSILRNLLESTNLSYHNCQDDRKKLHDIEWNSPDTTPSILGEVEIFSDYYVGCIESCLKKNFQNADETIIKLENRRIIDINVITDWIANSALNYIKYFTYIQTVENLRNISIQILTKYIEHNKTFQLTAKGSGN